MLSWVHGGRWGPQALTSTGSGQLLLGQQRTPAPCVPLAWPLPACLGAGTYEELARGYFRAAMVLGVWLANHQFYLDAAFSCVMTGRLMRGLWGLVGCVWASAPNAHCMLA